ncbi:hypothetical protein WDU94_012692 [Cyamophila willieti]
MDEDFKRNNTRSFYRTFKSNLQKYQNQNLCFKNEKGELALNDEENCDILAKYFETLLNCDEPEQRFSLKTPSRRNEDSEPPTVEELAEIIENMKNEKSPREDGIIVEMWKAVNLNTLEVLEKLIKQIWYTEELPEEWKTALIHPIHKKGDKTDPNNYRGISLLQVTYKILSKALQNRLDKQVDKEIGEYQGGFRQGRSCVEQILNLKFIIRHRRLSGKRTFITFVDFKKAYDSIDRETLFNTLEEFGVIRKWREKNVKCGIKKIKIGRNKDLEVDCLAFADDLAIFSEDVTDAIKLINNLKESAEKAGLQISFEKTEYITDMDGAPREMKTKYGVIKKVTKFKYLGEIITPNGLDKEANQVRMRKMETAFQLTRNTYNKKSLSMNAKLRHYNTVIKPESMYASECLSLNTAKQLQELEKKERKIIRKILGPKQVNGIWKLRSNEEVYEKTERIGDTIRKRRVQLYGHLKRMKETRFTKQLFNYFDKNPKTRLTWFIETKKDLAEMEIPETEISERDKFRERVKTFKGYKEKEKKKTGAPWTEERKQQHREKMKKYWEERKKQ